MDELQAALLGAAVVTVETAPWLQRRAGKDMLLASAKRDGFVEGQAVA